MLTITISIILAIILIPLINWYLNVFKYWRLRKLPGPKPVPIFGSASLLGSGTVELLHSFMKLQKQYGTIYKLWLGPRLHLMITKPETLENLLNSTVHLSKSDGYDLFRPWLGDGLLVSTGRKWKSRRKMITPTFHFKILEQFLQVFNVQMNIMLDILTKEVETKPNESIEVHNSINLCSLDIICETAFGTSINAQFKGNPKYVEAVTGFLEIFTERFFSGWLRNPLIFRFSKHYRQYCEYLKILHAFTHKIIKQRKQEFDNISEENAHDNNEIGLKKRAALLDMLLEAADGGKALTDEDIREEVDTFMFEGHDTASAAICFVLLAIAQNPDIQKKVYEELVEVFGTDSKQDLSVTQINDLNYLDVIVKEALRMYPPVPLIEKSLDEDYTIDGISIPKGTTISIFLYGMNHNPDVFPDPDKFDPDRFLPEKQSSRHNYAYVPFSAGPRNCIGQKFALLELKASIVKMLLHFELAADPNFTAQIGMCSVLKSRNGIKLMLKRRG